jgi:hypothetical protein
MSQIVDVVFGHWARTLGLVFVSALLVRVIFTLTLQEGFYFPDSIDYSNAANNLITHGEFGDNYNRPPGYPIFLAAIYSLFG